MAYVRIGDALHERFKVAAARLGRPMQAIVESAVMPIVEGVESGTSPMPLAVPKSNLPDTREKGIPPLPEKVLNLMATDARYRSVVLAIAEGWGGEVGAVHDSERRAGEILENADAIAAELEKDARTRKRASGGRGRTQEVGGRPVPANGKG